MDGMLRSVRHAEKDRKALTKGIIPSLLNNGWLLAHKGGDCLSLNAHKKVGILNFIRGYYPLASPK